jgi:hypothetical protein
MQAVLKAQINKTDRNDARGIAQMMRAGLYRPVHVIGIAANFRTNTAAAASAGRISRARPQFGRSRRAYFLS